MKHVNPESIAILANLAQHLKQNQNPGAELLRLLRLIDKELKPKLRIEAKKKE